MLTKDELEQIRGAIREEVTAGVTRLTKKIETVDKKVDAVDLKINTVDLKVEAVNSNLGKAQEQILDQDVTLLAIPASLK